MDMVKNNPSKLFNAFVNWLKKSGVEVSKSVITSYTSHPITRQKDHAAKVLNELELVAAFQKAQGLDPDVKGLNPSLVNALAKKMRVEMAAAAATNKPAAPSEKRQPTPKSKPNGPIFKGPRM